MSEVRVVTIDLRITASTDRDPSEWGEQLARFLQAEMRDNTGDLPQDA